MKAEWYKVGNKTSFHIRLTMLYQGSDHWWQFQKQFCYQMVTG